MMASCERDQAPTGYMTLKIGTRLASSRVRFCAQSQSVHWVMLETTQSFSKLLVSAVYKAELGWFSCSAKGMERMMCHKAGTRHKNAIYYHQ